MATQGPMEEGKEERRGGRRKLSRIALREKTKMKQVRSPTPTISTSSTTIARRRRFPEGGPLNREHDSPNDRKPGRPRRWHCLWPIV